MNVKELIRDLSLCEKMEQTDIYFKDKKGRLFPIRALNLEKETKTKGRTLKKDYVVYTVYLTDTEQGEE